MSVNINKYTAEANRFLNEVAAELGNPASLQAAGRVIVAVFHTLREKLSAAESFQLLASLPMILKGVYVDGWDPAQQMHRTETLEDFVKELRSHSESGADRAFANTEQAIMNFKAVLRVMAHYVPDEEMSHIRHQLPRPVAELFETW